MLCGWLFLFNFGEEMHRLFFCSCLCPYCFLRRPFPPHPPSHCSRDWQCALWCCPGMAGWWGTSGTLGPLLVPKSITLRFLGSFRGRGGGVQPHLPPSNSLLLTTSGRPFFFFFKLYFFYFNDSTDMPYLGGLPANGSQGL